MFWVIWRLNALMEIKKSSGSLLDSSQNDTVLNTTRSLVSYVAI